MLHGPFSPEQRGDYRQMMEINLLGASVAGRTARPRNAVYAATKWRIVGWSEGCARSCSRTGA